MINRRLSFLYASCDFLCSAAAWSLFYLVRSSAEGFGDPLSSMLTARFIAATIIIAFFWVLLFAFTGFYKVSLKRSRLAELTYSILVTLPGVFILFFILLARGVITNNSLFLHLLLVLFFSQLALTYLPRLLITSYTAARVHRGLLGYNTIIIGSNGRAFDIFKRIKQEKIPSGNILRGYVSIRGNDNGPLKDHLPCLGRVDDLASVISGNRIEEVIIAVEGDEHDTIGEILGKLEYNDITIKVIPSLKDYLTGRVEQSAIFGTPLLEIPRSLMPVWQANIKVIMDYVLALLLLIVLAPFIILISVLIRISGKGPAIFSQERIGKGGKPFTIYKFRSMYADAENEQPLLSSSNDSRITPFGRFMRKHRIDEIPNLVNVLKGEMSLVGPRPERQYFIDRIVVKAPHFRRLLKVKPGITSWGQVKYGYASNVDQMVERLEYDILYLENMTLLIDLKILIYTLLIILKGKGV